MRAIFIQVDYISNATALAAYRSNVATEAGYRLHVTAEAAYHPNVTVFFLEIGSIQSATSNIDYRPKRYRGLSSNGPHSKRYRSLCDLSFCARFRKPD